MPSFNIARAGSSYPKMTRNAVPVGAIFKAVDGDGLTRTSYVNIGTVGTNIYSLNITNLTIASTRNTSREVAMVGQVTYNRTFYEEAEHKVQSISDSVTSDVFVVKGKANEDGLPIVYGLLGHTDEGDYLAVNFNEPGTVVKFRNSLPVTVVGKFGIVGTEV